MFPSLSFTSSSRCPDKKADVAKEVAGLTLSDVENVYPTRPEATPTIAINAIIDNLSFMDHISYCTRYI